MDLGYLFASFLISGIGMVLLTYGRRQSRAPHIAIGLLLLGSPYAVSDVPWMLGVAALLLGLLWALSYLGF